MAETVMVPKAEWEQMKMRVTTLEELSKPKPKVNYSYKFGGIVDEWLEKQQDNTRKRVDYKSAIYQAVKACLGLNHISELNKDNYDYALQIFEDQKIFFRKRIFPEGAITHGDTEETAH